MNFEKLASDAKIISMRPFLIRYEKEIRLLLLSLIYLAFLTPLIVGTRFLFPFVFPKAIFFQTLMQIGLILYVCLLIVDRAYLPKFSWILVFILVYIALIALSTFIGVDPALSFWSKAERMDGLFQYLHLSVFLLILLAAVRYEADWLRLFKFVVGSGWVIGSVALITKYLPGFMNFGDQTRLGATFGNSAFLSTYFLVLAFLAFIFILRSRGHERWFFALSFVFFLWLILLSGTRGAFAGFIFGIVAFLFFLGVADWRKWGRFAGLGILSLLLLTVVVYLSKDILWDLWPGTAERIFGLWQFPKARLISWQIGLEAFKARPLFGWGPENYIYAFNLHFEPDIHTYDLALFDRAHNKIIDLLVFHGFLGPVVYLVLFGIIFWELFAISRKRLVNPVWPAGFLGLMAGYFVQNLVLFEMPSSGLILFLLLGFLSWLSGEVYEEKKKQKSLAEKETSKTRRFLPSWILVPVFLLVIASFYTGIIKPYRAAKGVVAAAAILGDSRSLAETRMAEGLTLYQKARDKSTFLDREVDVILARRLRELTSVEPNISNTPLYAEFVQKLIKNLEDDFQRHPLDYDVLMEIGNLYFALGAQNPEFIEKAPAYWNKAIEIAPKREDAYQQFAFWYMSKGDMAKAGEYLKKLLELNDKVGIFWWFQAIYESKIGDEKSLEHALDRAKDLKYDWDEMPNNIEFVADNLSRRNKHREAARYYETLLKIPDLEWQTEFRNQAKLMKTYLLLGEKKKATELAKIALEKSPQNQKAQVEAILKELGLR